MNNQKNQLDIHDLNIYLDFPIHSPCFVAMQYEFWVCQAKLQSEFTIYGSVGETFEWNIRENFFKGGEMKYQLSQTPSKYFEKPRQPLSEIGPSNMHGAVVSNVVSIKPYINQLTGTWLNSFVFIEQDNSSVDLFYSVGKSTENDQVPNFEKYINIAKTLPNFQCFDVDFLSDSTFIVDCQQDEKNYFLIVDTSSQKSTIENTQPFNQPTLRKILVHNFFYADMIIQLLIRGQYQQDKGSLIELYLITGNVVGQTAALTLDSATLAQLLSQSESFVFTFIDMQIEANGDLFILDAYNGIYILNILESMKWSVKEWSRLNYGQEVYAFDFTYMLNSTKQLVVVFEDRIQYFQDNVPKGTLPLPGPIKPQMQIEISQTYIVLRYLTGIYVYNWSQLLYSFLEDLVDQIIINPYEPDLIGVSEIAAHRFLISDGVLRLLKQDSPTDALFITELKAIPTSGDYCSVLLQIQIVYQNSTQLFETNDQSFPASLTIPADPFNVDLIAIGPDISYQPIQQSENEIQIEIKEMWKLDIEIKNNSVAFTDIYVFSEEGFKVLQQLSTKEMFFYGCEHNKFQQTEAKCHLQQHCQLNVIASKTTFSWWFMDDEFFYLIQESEKHLILYTVNANETSKVDEIQLTEKILSFVLLRGMLFIAQRDKVLVYGFETHFQLSYTLTNIESPVRVFGNKNIDLIFIQTTQSIIIGHMAVLTSGSSFTLIKQIPVILGSDVFVTLGTNYFFILQKTATISQIDEYDYSHLQTIFKTKSLPLYNYNIQEPIVADACEVSGWLFLRGQNNQETVILVYEPGVLSHQSLKKVIKLGSVTEVTVEADGGSQMFLHYQQQIFSILQDSLLYVISNIKSDLYVNDILSGVIATNSESTKQILKKIKILDTHSLPIFDNTYNKTYPIIKQNDIEIIKVNTSLYTGQITEMTISCSQSTQVFLTPPITNVTDGKDMSYDLIDGLLYNANYLVYLQSKQLIFQYRNGSFFKVFDMKSNITILETGDGLFISEDKKYLLVSVLGASQSILLIECNPLLECNITKKLTIPDAKRINIVKLMNPNHLVILNSNPNDFSQVESSILVYILNNDFSLTTVQIINAKLLNLEYLNIASLEIVRHNKFYTLFYTDSSIGIRISHFNSIDLSYQASDEILSLATYQHEQFFVHQNTNFYQVHAIKTIIEENRTTIMTLIQTSNVAQYIFNLPFDTSVIPFLQKQGIELSYVLTPFGSWQSVNKLAYMLNHIIIPYYQGTQAILVVYELIDSKNTKTISSTYALQENYEGLLSNKFALILEIIDNQVYFYTNLKDYKTTMRHVLIKYQFNSNPIIVLKNASTITPQPITVTVSNHFGQSSGIVHLVYSSDDDDNKTDHTWIWILVGVLGGVIIILVSLCLFLYFRYKRQKKSEILLS